MPAQGSNPKETSPQQTTPFPQGMTQLICWLPSRNKIQGFIFSQVHSLNQQVSGLRSSQLPWDSLPFELQASAHWEAVSSKGFDLSGELPHPETSAHESNKKKSLMSCTWHLWQIFMLLPVSVHITYAKNKLKTAIEQENVSKGLTQ